MMPDTVGQSGSHPEPQADATLTIRADLLSRVWWGAWQWVTSRDPVATLCLLLLGIVGWGAWDLGKNIIPQTIAAVQDNQKALADAYIADREKLTAQYLTDKNEMRAAADREREQISLWHDRQLSELGRRLESIVERYERVTTAQERLVRDLILREGGGQERAMP